MQMIKTGDLDLYDKLAHMFMICKDRAINEYDNINAYQYFNNNSVMQSILEYFLGLDANKVSLSGFMKNVYSVYDSTTYPFTPKTTLISKYPTQQSLFDVWEKFLINRGVKIHTNSYLKNINTSNGKIDSINVFINNQDNIMTASEYIFACSLPSIVKIISNNNDLFNLPTFQKLKILQRDLQLYFTINIYFSEELGSLTNNNCNEMVIMDMPWKPIIQKKRNWKNNYLNNCLDKIKDVWNVGFLDNDRN